MARSRILKPEFFLNPELLGLPALARLLYAGLWTQADRDGRLEDRPGKIKLAVLPSDDCDVDDLLRQLAEKELVIRYEVDGVRYLAIPKFLDHQCPHVSEKSKGLPPPPTKPSTVLAQDKHSASTVLAPDKHRTCTPHSDSDSDSDSGCDSDSNKTSPKLRFTDDDRILAQEMFQLIRELNPNAKEPKLDAWANEFRVMREKDGADRSVDGIRSLMRWALNHSFWRGVVLSPAALRKQWDKLTVQRKEQHEPRSNSNRPSAAKWQGDNNDFAHLASGASAPAAGSANGELERRVG